MKHTRELNLELGWPTVDQALRRLDAELEAARQMNTPLMKLIHGYGSSGAGGRIRVEARRRLDRMKAGGEIWGYIPGEEFSIFNPATLEAFRRCGALRKDPDLERHNNGVTIILL